MSNIELKNGQKITNKFQHLICSDYDEAVKLGVQEYRWKESEILDRNEKLSVQVDNEEVIEIHLNCITVDSGGEDYIYYIN